MENVAALKLYPARIEGDAIMVDAAAVNRDPPAAAAGFGISRADNGASQSAISAETDRNAADVVVEFDHLHGERAPGWRYPVKAVSRRSRAREQRELLPDGTGLAPYL